MRSLLIEFLRYNNLDTGIWREGDPYLLAPGSNAPIRQFNSPLEQETFLDLTRNLRYQGDAAGRLTALKDIGKIAFGLLGDGTLKDISTGEFPLQLDLVVNPAEVAALPFEAAMNGEGNVLFTVPDPAVIITRRVRAPTFAEKSVNWPAHPRLLFAWAAPPGAGEVPHEAHRQALRDALGPWVPEVQGAGNSGGSGILTVLEKVTLERLKDECRNAVNAKKPFTHVHLLAHGHPVGEAHKQHFGLALHDPTGDLDAVTPEAIEDALAPLVGHAVVVTLAVCDSANLTNTITSKRSIAHGLHVQGFPVVVASQFPLTVPGSTVMVSRFYSALLNGQDVRRALHHARVELYRAKDTTGHDWASMVGYVRLPEGYADHLLDIRLQSALTSLKLIQKWSDELVKFGSNDVTLFERVAFELQSRIRSLREFLDDTRKSPRRGVVEENLGLLGSAEKRLAELYFTLNRLSPAPQWKTSMLDAIMRSRDWYRECYRYNLSHHWTGVQQLSLEAVLDGSINPRQWNAAMAAAEIDLDKKERQDDVIWALGSLAELYVLAPLAGQNHLSSAGNDALLKMKLLVEAQSPLDRYPIETTRRQLLRYVDWWTEANGFPKANKDVAARAKALSEVLCR